MKLWLIGMMGSGKSSAGRKAALSLGVAYHDTDELVADRMGCSVAQLWEEQGETAFREIEKVAVRDLARSEGIISTGGGVVLDPDSRLLIMGPKVVWLQASPGELAARLETTSNRPGLAASDLDEVSFLTQMLDLRTPVYEQLATHRIDTEGLSSDAVAAMIETIWRA